MFAALFIHLYCHRLKLSAPSFVCSSVYTNKQTQARRHLPIYLFIYLSICTCIPVPIHTCAPSTKVTRTCNASSIHNYRVLKGSPLQAYMGEQQQASGSKPPRLFLDS